MSSKDALRCEIRRNLANGEHLTGNADVNTVPSLVRGRCRDYNHPSKSSNGYDEGIVQTTNIDASQATLFALSIKGN